MSKSTTIIAGVFLAAIVTGAGWWAVTSGDRSSQNKNQQNSASASLVPTVTPTSTEPASAVAEEFLTIAEWGIAFKVPKDLQDDIYYVLEDDQSLPGTSINLISRRLERQLPRCANGIIGQGSAYNGFVSITREKDGDGATLTDRTPPALLIRDQYGYFNRGTYCSEDPAFTASDKASMDALLESFKTTLVTL